MEALILFCLLLLLITFSVPVGIAVGVATAICMGTMSSVPLIMIAQKSFTGLDSFPLLAIPFFMLAGALMCNGGISRRLVNLAESLVGFVVGGLSMVTVLACMFFAAISGSGPATVSAIGSFMIPSMKERGYHGNFAAAITASAGTIGVIIPPSIPFVVYSVIAQTSIGDMFIAGVIPGIVIGICLMGVCYVIAKRRNYQATSMERVDLRKLVKAFRDAFWALLVPVIILGGIYAGVFTPTEAAVVAIAYSVIIGKFVYKELTWGMLYECLRTSALLNGATQFLVGLALAFGSYLALENIPIQVTNWLMQQTSNPYLILLYINIFLLLVGCFIDNIAAVIILTPILLPIVTKLGMHPIQFGIVITVNLAIGFVTPPYGINLFVASAISGESIERISKEVLPFIGAMLVCLMLCTYIPQFSLYLLEVFRH